MSLGSKIRAARKELRLSLRELGQRAELAASFLCDVERDKRGIGADSLLRISRVIGVPLDQLMNEANGQVPDYSECLLELPGTLVSFAAAANVPFRHALCLYWCARTIRDHKVNTDKRPIEDMDWLRFYEALKDWL